jgi:hypothetical protein
MDSLGYGANIVGPDAGAFKDLRKENLIETFTGFDDLINKIDRQLASDGFNSSNHLTANFLNENSWDKFAEKLYHIL